MRDAARDDYRWSSLVLGIVKSLPFQMRRAPTADEPYRPRPRSRNGAKRTVACGARAREMAANDHHEEALVPPHGLAWVRRNTRVAVAGQHGSGADRAQQDGCRAGAAVRRVLRAQRDVHGLLVSQRRRGRSRSCRRRCGRWPSSRTGSFSSAGSRTRLRTSSRVAAIMRARPARS